MKENSKNHTKYLIGYHIVFCPKYRNALEECYIIELKKIFYEISIEYEWKIESLEILPDHVHLYIMGDPDTKPNEISKTLKSISAVYLFEKFKGLKQRKFWGSGLWSRGTYYSTVGISDEALRNYIESQLNETHHSSHRTSL